MAGRGIRRHRPDQLRHPHRREIGPVDRRSGQGPDPRLPHKDFTAGRQGSLVISDDHASSQHCLFQPAHGFWYVEDLGSTNGTWLNGRRMFAAQRLKKGDKVKIGRTVIVVVST